MAKYNRVVIEAGSKKVFASAIDWPGLCRSAKTEDEALETLRQYAERYQHVADRAGIAGLDEAANSFEIVERLAGNATTDFGVPDLTAAAEIGEMSDADCEHQIALLRGCWLVFDETAARVSEELRKGPRGGGRNRTKLVEHTLEAERYYARQIGVKTPKGGLDTRDGIATHRDAIVEAIRRVNAEAEPSSRWSLRYFIRRAAWHVMDHTWEMEDKDLTGTA